MGGSPGLQSQAIKGDPWVAAVKLGHGYVCRRSPPENLVLLRRAQGECREGAAGKKRQRRARRLC